MTTAVNCDEACGQDDDVCINVQLENSDCNHNISQKSFCAVRIGTVKFCSLIDTGAQISVYKLLKAQNDSLELYDLRDRTITGINNSCTSMLGYVNLKLNISEFHLSCPIPFVFVD